ncbi:MAG: orotate phosphoribosyltransferase [Chloroflexi bacterium]|nr:orotate phosphoribosyltransferase [Chloroflexota bacterium]
MTTPRAPFFVPNTSDMLLERALRLGAVQYGEFKLTSGKTSSYYFDGRLLTLDSEGAYLVGRALYPLVRGAGAQAVGGLTLGADPIASAVALTAHINGERLSGFIVRKEAKQHGAKRQVEGPVKAGMRVAVVDDVCTTAGSILQAVESMEAMGCKVVLTAAILDRREGGSDLLREKGYPFACLLEATPEGKVKVTVR